MERNWPCFGLPQPCRSNIYVIASVKVSNRSIKKLFNCPQLKITLEMVIGKQMKEEGMIKIITSFYI